MSGGSTRQLETDPDGSDCRHSDWLARVPEGPLYCLPEKAIARLEQSYPRCPPLLDGVAAKAERHLLALCQREHAVGYDGSRPINYPYLTPPLPLPAREGVPDPGWSEAQWFGLKQLIAKAETINQRLKGYSGWLSVDPTFLSALRCLEARWCSLPEAERPCFPLHPAVRVVRPPDGASPAREPVGAFMGDFGSFCDRWGLIGMATWDFPLPQGPLLPSLLPADSPALPAHGVHLVLPLHYNLAGDDDLLAEILHHQQVLAGKLGLESSIAGLPHYKIYAQLLDVVHLERTVGSRYAGTRPPRGFVGVLVEAIAEQLDVSVDQVRRLRKTIAACRRGRRADVERLRSRGR